MSTALIKHRRLDYLPPDYRIGRVQLQFELGLQQTRVKAQLHFERSLAIPPNTPWRLNGEDLELISISIDGKALGRNDYEVQAAYLSIFSPPEKGVLTTEVIIRPDQNTRLEGLYASAGGLFTQCEAEGFRRITYFPDRPDVMAVYHVTLIAKGDEFPVLLSNGNLIKQGKMPDGRLFAQWQDPFPKPCYLFALVAAKLVANTQKIKLADGREATLQVWVEPENLKQTDHAMRSLVKSIRWDEQQYGRVLDLDRFMIVAVSHFNMGAMENKGLNLFNARYVLADPSSATDTDYDNIESIVAHEYFHNWTGNRITCRDWFQLSLKEGLTVFRDQSFSADSEAEGLAPEAAASARAVRRIDDVKVLRASQFPEDAGPMAHPIRPDEYAEINNFYTVTVYEKGAEVIRMLHTLLGPDAFRRGMDQYFSWFDGQAVTCDDFVDAMAWALKHHSSQAIQTQLGGDLEAFRQSWYSQAGTPVVKAQWRHDKSSATWTLTLKQQGSTKPGSDPKQTWVCPIRLGLLNAQGQALPLAVSVQTGNSRPSAPAQPANGWPTETVIVLNQAEQRWVFHGIKEPPVPSLLRGFSAPIRLEQALTTTERLFLLAHDQDGFNRWEAAQQLFIEALCHDDKQQAHDSLLHPLTQALITVLGDDKLSPAFRAQLLNPPSLAELCEHAASPVDPQLLHERRERWLSRFAEQAASTMRTCLDKLNPIADQTPYAPVPQQTGARQLRAWLIQQLARIGDTAPAVQLEAKASNMTDRMAALTCLVYQGAAEASAALARFEQQFRNQPLVMDKWFALQASAPLRTNWTAAQQLQTVKQLMQHPSFDASNPNRVRAVVAQFCHANLTAFHAPDGTGYAFWAEQVLRLNDSNPQVAARLARALDRWPRYVTANVAKAALQTVERHGGLSTDVREIIHKALHQK